MSNIMKDWIADSRAEQKAELLAYMKYPAFPQPRNIMGISESWYDPKYAIDKTFSMSEVEHMTPLEVDHLFRLAIMIMKNMIHFQS